MNKRKYKLDEHIFDKIDTPAKAYWLGYLYCDGSIYVHSCTPQVNLHSKDLDVVQKFHNFLKTNRPIYHTNNILQGRKYTGHEQYANSRHLVDTLGTYGIIPRKTYDHSVSVYIPKGNLEHHFWRGCIDADGGISVGIQKEASNQYGKKYGPYYRKRVSLYFYNANLPLVNKIKGFFKIGNVQESENIFKWLKGPVSSKTILSLLDKLYKNTSKNIRMDRKYRKFLEVKSLVLA